MPICWLSSTNEDQNGTARDIINSVVGSDRSSGCHFVRPSSTSLSRAFNLHLSGSDSSGDFIMTSWWLQDDLRTTSGWPQNGSKSNNQRGTQRTLKEHSESKQTSSYRRSLKYFVLFNSKRKIPIRVGTSFQTLTWIDMYLYKSGHR